MRFLLTALTFLNTMALVAPDAKGSILNVTLSQDVSANAIVAAPGDSESKSNSTLGPISFSASASDRDVFYFGALSTSAFAKQTVDTWSLTNDLDLRVELYASGGLSGDGDADARSDFAITFELDSLYDYDLTGSNTNNIDAAVTLTGTSGTIWSKAGNLGVESGNISGTLGPGTYTLSGHASSQGWPSSSSTIDMSLTEPTVSSIPEPSTYITLSGLILCFGLAGWWRRRRQAA